MDDFFGKFTLYDILVRLVTGLIILIVSWLVGVLNWLSNIEIQINLPAWTAFPGAYFIGIVFEEISYMLETKLHLRKNMEKSVLPDEFKANNNKKFENRKKQI